MSEILLFYIDLSFLSLSFFNYKSSFFILPFMDNVKFSKKQLLSLKYTAINCSK